MEADTSWFAEALGHCLYYFAQIQPYIPTYIFLFISSILPIYAGAHASLYRPVSAAKPPRRRGEDDSAIQVKIEEETNVMQGFEKSDVILYPLFAGAMLAGLYWVITYLEEAAIVIITNILNAYMSIFGLIGIFAFLSDGLEMLMSFVFPSKYFDAGRLWLVDDGRRLALPLKMSKDDKHPGRRLSPSPSSLARLIFPYEMLWWIKELATRPAFIIEMQAYKLVTNIRPTPIRILCAQLSVVIVLYYNLVDRAWWLTNLLGFSFTYSAFQIVSPTNFQIGTMLLSALLLYDIYMVFFTPMMVTVATKLDIPAKIMIPNPDMEGKRAFSMLGLGDIVIPGIMMAMALRFDLYMFYLKKQRIEVYKELNTPSSNSEASIDDTNKAQNLETGEGDKKEPVDGEASANNFAKPEDSFSHGASDGKKQQVSTGQRLKLSKRPYQKVTGTWGDRFWLGKYADFFAGGSFPKVYFRASLVGYLLGLVVTLVILHIFEHGQPALLYLVPGVLGAIWLTALIRGEAGVMWKYTEDPDEGRSAGIDSAGILGPAKLAAMQRVQQERERHREDLVASLGLLGEKQKEIKSQAKDAEGSSEKENQQEPKSDARIQKSETELKKDEAPREETEKKEDEQADKQLANNPEKSPGNSDNKDENMPQPSKDHNPRDNMQVNRRIFQLSISLPPLRPHHKEIMSKEATEKKAALSADANNNQPEPKHEVGLKQEDRDEHEEFWTEDAFVSTYNSADGRGEPWEKRRRIT